MLAVASSDALLLYDFSAHARVSLFGFDVDGDARASVALKTSIAKPTRVESITQQQQQQVSPRRAAPTSDENNDDDNEDDDSSSSIGEIG